MVLADSSKTYIRSAGGLWEDCTEEQMLTILDILVAGQPLYEGIQNKEALLLYLEEVQRRVAHKTQDRPTKSEAGEASTTTSKSTESTLHEVTETFNRLEMKVKRENGNEDDSTHKDKRKLDWGPTKSVPMFYGNSGENIDHWLFLVENMLENMDAREHEELRIVTTCLKGNALEMVKSYKASTNSPSWKVFKKELKKTYLPIHTQIKIRDELATLSCKTKGSYEAYLQSFRSLKNQLVDMPEQEIIYSFL